MTLLSTIVAFLLALGVLIVFHELGHYLVARWCGVKVLRFSLGFGRPLLRRRVGPDQTEWVLAAIPFGGYVSMLDEREQQDDGKGGIKAIAAADLPRAFNRQSVGKRAAIVVAGPLANFLLAIVLYTGLNLHGVDEPRALLGAAPAGTLAARAGLEAGAEVVSVDGTPVRSLIDLRWKLLGAAVDHARPKLGLKYASRMDFITLDLSALDGDALQTDFLRDSGIVPARPHPVLGDLGAGGAAARAGLQPGDVLLAVDGQAVGGAEELVKLVRAAPGRTLAVDIDRAGTRLRVVLTPDVRAAAAGAANAPAQGRIDAAIRSMMPMTTVRYGLVEAFTLSVTKTWDTSVFSLRMIGKMIMGEVSVRNLSGPVTIADYAGQSARLGAAAYLTFIAFISISIGLMNLLPVPMLDGGHLLYYLVEILLGRAPSEKVIEWGQRAGFAVLVSLMFVALFNDFARLLS